MPKKVEYTLEFKDQAVRLVAAEREPNESVRLRARGLNLAWG